MSSFRRHAPLVAVCTLGACKAIFGNSNPGDGNNAAGRVIQVVSATPSSGIISCANTNRLLINVVVVNTTSDDETVVRVGSGGVVLRAEADSSSVGSLVYTIDSLPFTPAATVLRANDGQVTYRVTLDAPCPPIRTPSFQFADLTLQLYMTTKTGQFATGPILFRIIAD